MRIGGIYRTTNPTLTDGQWTDLAIDESGALRTSAAPSAAGSLSNAATLTGLRINTAATGDITLVSATASQTTKVYRFRLTAAAATNVSIKDGAGTVLEIIQFPAAGAIVLDLSTRPYWTTTVNTAFIINQSAAVAIEGRMDYIKS
ncbi:MAG: hypothetical protein V4657_11460 [Pseudomonadota bacterium]